VNKLHTEKLIIGQIWNWEVDFLSDGRDTEIKPVEHRLVTSNGVGFSHTRSEVIMRSTRQFSITLTPELAEMVHRLVESGQYATDSEVIRDGLRLIGARDRAVEAWLKDEVVPAYEKLKADPSRAIPEEDFDAQMEARRAARRRSVA
jgi:putative addiction module CopG family antidote